MLLQSSVVTSGPAPVFRFPLGLLAGILATFAMDVVMARIDEGETPPTVASGVLTSTHPDRAPERLASVVHYLAGLLTGPLFVYVLYATEFVLGRSFLTTAVAAAVLFVVMVGFFTVVVLPRPDGLSADRRKRVASAWSYVALSYVVVLVVLVEIGSSII